MAITKKPTTPDQNPNPNPSLPPQTNPNNPQTTTDLPAAAAETGSDYEKTREQRIKENRERLQKLGIVDLSNQLKSISANNTPRRTPKNERKTPLKLPSIGSPESRRRSSRLQNAPPVTYTEPKEVKSRKTRDIVLEEGAKPEYYTEEHDKLLGSTEMTWTLFVDGVVNGSRVYDSVNGKTCHQCRQKTLGQRTRCSNCTLVQGQFCGDCLYMRYGEHVVEANQNPNWICPPCRGICNCSLCRQARGWYPTGPLYKRISNLGYKSVAHYLIETKREPSAEETVSDTQQSAKRALPFEGMEVPNDDSDDQAPENTEPDQIPNAISGKKFKKENGSGLAVHEPTPENADASKEFVMNAGVAENELAPDKKSPEVIKRGRGRGRKISMTENAAVAEGVPVPENASAGDVAEHEPNPENADAGKESVTNADVAEAVRVPDIKSPEITGRGRGRPRKRAKMESAAVSEGAPIPAEASAGDVAEHEPNPENADAGEETVMNADVAEDVRAPDKRSPEVIKRGRGRARKRSEMENAAVAEGVSVPENANVAEDARLPDRKSPEVSRRGRPGKKAKTENAAVAEDVPVPGEVVEYEHVPANTDACEEPVINADVAEYGSVHDIKSPDVIKRGRGRPRKDSLTGNAAVAEDAPVPGEVVAEYEPVPVNADAYVKPVINVYVAEDECVHDKKSPEVIKRGRGRKTSLTGNAAVAEDAPVPGEVVVEYEPVPVNTDACKEPATDADAAEDACVHDKKSPEVIKRGRGRPRKTSLTGNASVAEDAPVPESISVY